MVLSAGVCFVLVLTGGAQTNIPRVFSTGVADSGSLLSAGQPDPHWTISSSPIGAVPAPVTGSLHRNWITNTASSQWINATGIGTNSEATGLYVYTLTFSLNGFEPATAQVTGEWASDNQSEIFLNGVDTGLSNGTNGFASLAPFSLTTNFVAGENELQFYVTQLPPSGKEDPEGLQVNIFSATAVPGPVMLSLNLLSETNVQLHFGGAVPGASYVLQHATNLSPPIPWQPFATNAADSNGGWTFTITNAIASFSAMFFRVASP
jgi:hypothetical protein